MINSYDFNFPDHKLSESSLHSKLKQSYYQNGDKIEFRINGFKIDIIKEDYLIEIQTKNFSAIKDKIEKLIDSNKLLLVHPIVQDKWILKYDLYSKQMIKKSLSPKHSSYQNIFEELIRIPHLISNPNLIIELLLVQVEEIWINNGCGSWRRKGWSIADRKLKKVLDQKLFSNPNQFLSLVPNEINTPFTNNDLSIHLNNSVKLARMMTYCLRKMDLIKIVGKRDRAYLFDFS